MPDKPSKEVGSKHTIPVTLDHFNQAKRNRAKEGYNVCGQCLVAIAIEEYFGQPVAIGYTEGDFVAEETKHNSDPEFIFDDHFLTRHFDFDVLTRSNVNAHLPTTIELEIVK